MAKELLDKINVTRPRAILFLVFTAVLWSFGGLFIKLIEWNPIAIAGMRSVMTALLLLALYGKPNFKFSFPQILAAIAYSSHLILFVTANKLTTAANTILLQYTSPIYVAILGALFLKERVYLSDWITIASVMLGMILSFMDSLKLGNLLGNILAILSGLFFAIMTVSLKYQKSGSPIMSIFWGNVLTVVIGIPFMFGPLPDTKSWITMLISGVFQLGLSYALYAMAIKKVTALESVLVPVIEPVLNPLFVFVFTGEVPGPWMLIGGTIILISVTAKCVYTSTRQ